MRQSARIRLARRGRPNKRRTVTTTTRVFVALLVTPAAALSPQPASAAEQVAQPARPPVFRCGDEPAAGNSRHRTLPAGTFRVPAGHGLCEIARALRRHGFRATGYGLCLANADRITNCDLVLRGQTLRLRSPARPNRHHHISTTTGRRSAATSGQRGPADRSLTGPESTNQINALTVVALALLALGIAPMLALGTLAALAIRRRLRQPALAVGLPDADATAVVAVDPAQDDTRLDLVSLLATHRGVARWAPRSDAEDAVTAAKHALRRASDAQAALREVDGTRAELIAQRKEASEAVVREARRARRLLCTQLATERLAEMRESGQTWLKGFVPAVAVRRTGCALRVHIEERQSPPAPDRLQSHAAALAAELGEKLSESVDVTFTRGAGRRQAR